MMPTLKVSHRNQLWHHVVVVNAVLDVCDNLCPLAHAIFYMVQYILTQTIIWSW